MTDAPTANEIPVEGTHDIAQSRESGKLRVLVACEFSGTVRDAFRALGHDAWSCDIIDADPKSDRHYKTDVGNVLNFGWDLLIGHPPCTYLCNSGIKHLYIDGRKENGRDHDRWENMRGAAQFFNILKSAPIPYIAIENPFPHPYATELIGKSTQKIQPWEFGHGETKETHLWLKNLPPLFPTDIVQGRENRIHKMAPSEDRGKQRSVFYPGIAAAMADQWGDFVMSRLPAPPEQENGK